MCACVCVKERKDVGYVGEELSMTMCERERESVCVCVCVKGIFSHLF